MRFVWKELLRYQNQANFILYMQIKGIFPVGIVCRTSLKYWHIRDIPKAILREALPQLRLQSHSEFRFVLWQVYTTIPTVQRLTSISELNWNLSFTCGKCLTELARLSDVKLGLHDSSRNGREPVPHDVWPFLLKGHLKKLQESCSQ